MNRKKMTPAQRQARAARTAFLAGAGFSIAANVMASEQSVVGIAFGTWPALALLMSVYLYENAPRNWWVKAGIAAMIAVAGWGSYWHIVHVALTHGVDPVGAHLMPITVDVMMALAQVVLRKKPSRPSPRRATAKKTSTRSLKSVA